MKKPSLTDLMKSKPEQVLFDDRKRTYLNEKERSTTKKMSLYVPEKIWKELQLRRIDEVRDVNAIINDAISRYLSSGSGI